MQGWSGRSADCHSRAQNTGAGLRRPGSRHSFITNAKLGMAWTFSNETFLKLSIVAASLGEGKLLIPSLAVIMTTVHNYLEVVERNLEGNVCIA